MRSELVVSGVADLASARSFARRRLHEWGVTDLDDTVALLISETVTNALLHAGTGAHVAIRFSGAVVRVEVRDGSVILPVVQQCTDMAATGRGLRLVEALAARWGVIPDRRGKTVWFELVTRPDPGDGNGHGRRTFGGSGRSGRDHDMPAGAHSGFDALRVALPALAS